MSGDCLGLHEDLESGKTPSVRGIVKCLNCNHYQSWISYNKKQIVVGPRRTSTCMKCSRRNRWRIYHPDTVPHGNAINYRSAIFIKHDKYTPRSVLVKEAQFENHFYNVAMGFTTYD